MSADTPRSNETAAKAAPRQMVLESVALVLLSLATVGTAWCSFQAAAWGGASQRITNLSMVAGRRATASQLQASQMALLDVALFAQYVNHRGNSNETLARFYSERFRGEAKTAFETWMAARPFENTNAPAHPFVTNLYQPKLLVDSRQAEAESDRLWQQAGEAGRTSRSYVLITVLLASALFCGGTAPKFDARLLRRGVLLLGLMAFAFALARLVSLPVQL